MRYYFKKFITVCKSKNKIYLYNGNKKNTSLSFEYNNDNIETISRLLLNGVDSNGVINNPIYKELFDNKFLYEDSRFQETKNINRNELFLNYLYEDITKNEIDKAKETKILIYGAGAGGSTLIYLLAQFGFKNISIIDYDKVEVSDVHRTMNFLKEDISKSKILALKEKIKDNFSIELNIFEGKYSEKIEIKKMIDIVKPDFIINVCDPKPSFKLDLNELCFEYEIPYISASYSYELISIGPIYVPLITACENSFDLLVQKNVRRGL